MVSRWALPLYSRCCLGSLCFSKKLLNRLHHTGAYELLDGYRDSIWNCCFIRVGCDFSFELELAEVIKSHFCMVGMSAISTFSSGETMLHIKCFLIVPTSCSEL